MSHHTPHSTLQSPSFVLRAAHLEDFEAIYDTFVHILEEGQTYSYTLEEMTPERSLAYWMTAPGTHCTVAEMENGNIGGFSAVRPNRTGLADHVANASFIVSAKCRGQGIARALGEHAVKQAKDLGYQAMQFNFVVSSNQVAVKLWQSLGFIIVGTLPKAYRHKEKGLVDVYLMHRFLNDL